MEKECHQLDFEVAKRSAPLSADGETFSMYAGVLAHLEVELTSYPVNLHSKIVYIGSQITNPKGNFLLLGPQEEVARAKQAISYGKSWRYAIALL